MGVDLIVVSKEQIEAVLFGNSRGIPSTASPLSEAPRGVASFLEEGGNGLFFGPKRGSSVVRPDRRMPGMLARHQVAAQGPANRRTCQGLGEANAFPCKLIDYRCFDQRVAHVGELVVGQLVRHEVDDVGFVGRSLGHERKGEKKQGLGRFHGRIKKQG